MTTWPTRPCIRRVQDCMYDASPTYTQVVTSYISGTSCRRAAVEPGMAISMNPCASMVTMFRYGLRRAGLMPNSMSQGWLRNFPIAASTSCAARRGEGRGGWKRDEGRGRRAGEQLREAGDGVPPGQKLRRAVVGERGRALQNLCAMFPCHRRDLRIVGGHHDAADGLAGQRAGNAVGDQRLAGDRVDVFVLHALGATAREDEGRGAHAGACANGTGWRSPVSLACLARSISPSTLCALSTSAQASKPGVWGSTGW